MASVVAGDQFPFSDPKCRELSRTFLAERGPHPADLRDSFLAGYRGAMWYLLLTHGQPLIAALGPGGTDGASSVLASPADTYHPMVE
jgi:hypothetical protein